MGLLDRITARAAGQSAAGGHLAYHGLWEWWLATFTDEERRHIQERYEHEGDGTKALTSGHIGYSSQTGASFLLVLASWLKGPRERHLAARALEKAANLAADDILDLHFVYSNMIEVYYRERDNWDGAFDAAVSACEKQIAIGYEAWAAFVSESTPQSFVPPSHLGFQQLAIIREKEGDIAEALRLCHEAVGQGWRDGKGDWSSGIDRLQRKADKQM